MRKKLNYQPAPVPEDEKDRLSSLKSLNILDTPSEERFDRITRLALSLFKVPISTVTLVDSNREWFKSYQGLSVREGKRAISFCGHALLADEVFVVPDTKKDPRFAGNPMVVGKPYIRFYAAVPLKSADGKKVGVFCLKDYKPRFFKKEKLELLKSLASWVELELNTHQLSLALESRRIAEVRIAELNEALRLLNKTLRHEILNTMTVVRGRIDMLASRQGKTAVFKELVSAIDQGIYIVWQMRELESAVSAGIPLKPYQLKQVIKKVIEDFPAIKFRVKGDGVILADQAIISVVKNIIRNSQIHGKTDKIDVTIQTNHNQVELIISDYGKGITNSFKDKLFQEGFKYGATGHIGLGLYIVRKTVERYGGKVRVKNSRPKGVTVIIQLPKPALN